MKLFIVLLHLILFLTNCATIDLTNQIENRNAEIKSSDVYKEVIRWISFANSKKKFFEEGNQDYLLLLDSLGVKNIKHFEKALYFEYLNKVSNNIDITIRNIEVLLQANEKELIFEKKYDEKLNEDIITYSGDTILFYEELKNFLIVLKFNLVIRDNEQNKASVLLNENYYYNIKYVNSTIDSIERYSVDYDGNIID
ncbi:MAG: hypothetical protein HND40_08265 [Ignavibacteriota bacterium]|mgnify:CR=1 FL=1|nr:hypothetical protein [Ignavibacteriota bacterium]MCO6447223.1 hypothetical protein [Ignavibacterium album]MCZ2269381.1 hypothetical protein [Ignavibacteriales bacterium]QKJ99547.1 MAG: hypothetical protein HND40_08265 [Ignavibacteriota bacterium]HOJ08629.1 hypothetical protein [Ignavibacteriaceae bacterium]